MKIICKLFLISLFASNLHAMNELPTIANLLENLAPEETEKNEMKLDEAELDIDNLELKYVSPLENVPTEELPTLEDFFDEVIPNEILAIIKILRGDGEDLGYRTLETNGILFDGPPGTGKTTIAHLIARQVNRKIVYASGGDFRTKYQGSGTKEIKKIFSYAANLNTPVVIIIDEFDGTAQANQNNLNTAEDDRTIKTIITTLDRYRENPNIFVIGTTNYSGKIESAITNRLRCYHIPLPTYKTRMKVIKYHLKRHNVSLTNGNARSIPLKTVEHMATATKGWSNRSLMCLVKKSIIEFDLNLQPERTRHSYLFQWYYFDFYNRPVSSILICTLGSPFLLLGSGVLMSKLRDTTLSKFLYAKYELEKENIQRRSKQPVI